MCSPWYHLKKLGTKAPRVPPAIHVLFVAIIPRVRDDQEEHHEVDGPEPAAYCAYEPAQPAPEGEDQGEAQQEQAQAEEGPGLEEAVEEGYVVGVVVHPVMLEGKAGLGAYPHADPYHEATDHVGPAGEGDVAAHVGDPGVPELEV